ncbi:thiamine pyrophosphate-binding protein [Alkaliphilus sp. B6464]|uniref:thiamine pyrophosphate-binding protein n=1 Tax=Alkaliphilus sp. B6464 TaxID=2731219 RepID=UPI001BAAECCD|nr:thiamine pyrophosphate-binding protein [Alkaliphilus sp. B6464]QUH21487.1 thiamine pyrophosphate-binding protein [Alkaliphilus sp. B6464]
MRISDAILKFLYNNGVTCSFGIPTAQMSAFNDGLNDCDIDYIVVKNEAAATYSAGRYSDLTRDLGVCFVGGCVGVNNGINGIADAYRNKLPVVIFSSYVNNATMNKNALQELITTDITLPITKYSKTIFDKENILEEVKKAIEIALTPPHGPVHISIPADIQAMPFEGDIPESINREALAPKYDMDSLNKAIDTIKSNKTGVIMVGRGARGLSKEIKSLSKKLQWPIITTPNAKGIINGDFELNLGNYGWCTTDRAADYINTTKFECTLILGTSLGQMSTVIYNKSLVEDKKVIHIDWDKTELNKIFKADIPVFCDLKLAINKLNESIIDTENNKLDIKQEANAPYVQNHTGLSLQLFMNKITDIVPDNTCFVQDMGENMNFSFRYLLLKENMDFQTSLNYACMGTAVGGALGSYMADPSKTYAVIVGDGSFFMNGMEILTAKEHNMPIIYFVINNAMLALVEHGGRFVFGRSHKGACTYERISITDMSKAMGIDAVQISNIEELDILKSKFENLSKPLVVELITDGSETCMDNSRWNKSK